MESLIRQYDTVNEAIVAKSFLLDHNIYSWLQDENIIRAQWYYSQAVGGVKLYVFESDAGRSRDLLRQIEKKYDESKGNKCQNCSSLKTVHYNRHSALEAFIIVLMFGTPLFLAPPLKYGYMRCLECKADYYDALDGKRPSRVSSPIVTFVIIIIGIILVSNL